MIQLKIRTEYTFGKTFAPLKKVVEYLQKSGCKAAGIVDLESTWGHVEWYKECKKAGIAPMLGLECVVSDDDENTHKMWFLAKNRAGLCELYQASSQAHHTPISTRSGRRMRFYTHDVRKMSDNIFKFAGECTDGAFLRDIGAFVDFSPASRILNAQKKKIAEVFALPTVEVCDNAYIEPTDFQAFEFCAKNAQKVTPQNIFTLPENENAQKIAEACADLELPKAPMIRAEGDLQALCREGIKRRGVVWTEEYEKRLNYELDLIQSKDFSSYFIIVADMVKYAKKYMLVGPSRGSAAGSLVCYVLGITEIDPLPPKLYFERFIDVTRVDLPDIDLDFPDNKRGLVFEYMAQKYGLQNVAHIGTITRFKPRSALSLVCKTLGIPQHETDAVKTAMIERGEADSRATNCLEDTFTDTAPGRAFLEKYPNAKIAQRLEGHASHTGVHAAGLLVCNDEITKYCVVDSNDIAHIDKNSAEALGLLKIDVLGLRTLAVLEDTGIDVDWYKLKPDDPKVFSLFNTGKLAGIFQFEGNTVRGITNSMVVKSIAEIDAFTALARPGPINSGVTDKYTERANGKKWESIHPKVDALMADTYGLPVYQEHTLAIVRDIGKFGWNETSFVRKAISKRQGVEFFRKFFPPFLKGALEQGIPEPAARATWELINAMGAWQMNKAHTYSYATISYWCAWAKTYYPLEFAAAVLRNAKDEESALTLLREMILHDGLKYVAFDPQVSDVTWKVQNGVLYGGFTNLKGIGESKARRLINMRENGGIPPAELQKLTALENTFADVTPMRRLYGHLYENPRAHNIAADKITYLTEIADAPPPPHGSERIFLGRLIWKNSRDDNEDGLIHKRGGKRINKPNTEFLDFRVRDDTGTCFCRIKSGNFAVLDGKTILEKFELGKVDLLIRARFFNGTRVAQVTKWKKL